MDQNTNPNPDSLPDINISALSITTPPPLIPSPPPIPSRLPLTPIPRSHLDKSSTITANTTNTFTLFPLLPFEIRLKIYSHINHTPRTVSISYKSVFHKPSKDSGFRTNSHMLSNNPSATVTTTGRRNVTRNGTRTGGGGNTSAVNGPSFTSRWISTTPQPALLGVSKESRAEALKVYALAFGSLEAKASIYFNFAVDTLYFSEGGGGAAPYRLDLFLGGDYYGCSDAEKILFLSLDVPEELYGRRSFCWEDVRGFRGLKEVTLVVREEEGEVDGEGEGKRQARLMGFYGKSLKRVWDAYVAGEGEGVDEGMGEWKVPDIGVWNVDSGKWWGRVGLAVNEGSSYGFA